jgi:hypothetical protein
MLREVEADAFRTDRKMQDYKQLLGKDFTAHLRRLEPDQHWVDAGAGHAGAIAEYLEGEAFPTKARVTAVSFVKPEGSRVAELEAKFAASGFRYLSGRPIEEMPWEEIGPADLITDVYGPLQYARQIDRTMAQYARILKAGATLWAVMPVTTFIKDRGEEVSLRQWFAALRGFDPVRLPLLDSGEREIVLTRTVEAFGAQRLLLDRALSGPPPLREYTLIDR